MTRLRVLVISASFGNGHLRAAEGIIEAIRLEKPDTEIMHLDYGEFLNKTLNKFVKSTYIFMIKYSPKLWGEFYYGTSKIMPDSFVQRLLNHMGRKDLELYIKSQEPDLIVCTYPTVAGVLSELRLNMTLRIPIATVVTDYAVHTQWIHPGVDIYFVGCLEVYNGMVARGIDGRRIKVTGIPVSLAFERPIDKDEIIARLELDPAAPIILIMGGALGVLENLIDVVRTFANGQEIVQLIVVCGQDRKLFQSLDEIMENAKHPIRRFAFVHNVEELMAAADLIITKAGGLTVSEALTRKLPQVIFKPIPGQEEENSFFLNRKGAGLTANSVEELTAIVQSLLEDPDKLEKMRQAADRAIPRHAAERAVEEMLALVDRINARQK